MSTEERKKLLILACEADRIAWCNACRPVPQAPTQIASHLFSFLEPFAALVPGWPGRLLRQASFLTRLGRQFGLIPS